MRILHVIASLAPRYGGPSKACVEMACAVRRLGHEVSIYTTNIDGDGELPVPTDRPVWREGVDIHHFPVHAPRSWGASFALWRALCRNLHSYDVVHTHSLYLFHNIVTPVLCRWKKVPYLVRPHGTLDPFIYDRHRWRKTIMEALFEKRNFNKAAAVHFTSEEERRLAAPFAGGVPSVVIPLGVDITEYNNLPRRGGLARAFPQLKGKRVVLFLGRLNFKKGLDLLAPAFRRVLKSVRDAHLVIAGPDDDTGRAARQWFSREEKAGHVTFTGMLRGKMKLAALRDAEVFVLPSYSENFGISVVEAMACGLPVVISNKVNIWREVSGCGAGLATSLRPDSVAKAISDVLMSPAMGTQMGRNGRRLVRERFELSRMATRLESTYGETLGGSTRAPERAWRPA